MHLTHISIGGGITGFETIVSIFEQVKKNLKKTKFKKISFVIIEKKIENMPGGVAYGSETSKYGYFNNPLRLSPKEFFKWILIKKNKKKLILYLKKNGGYTGQNWIKKNKKILFSSNLQKVKELYIPRVMLNIWMEEKLVSLISNIKKTNRNKPNLFEIKFYNAEVIRIKNNKNGLNKIFFKNNFCNELSYNIKKDPFKKIVFKKTKKNHSFLSSNTQSIGLGLPPPKQLATPKAQKSNNYIWDFYSEGATKLLIKKILFLTKIKKKLKIYFIGYKAGLLESLPELKETITKNKLKVELICSSKNLKSIGDAKLTLNKKKYKIQILNKERLNKIRKAKTILSLIKSEFKNAEISGYKKYDAWTQILEKNILNKCIKKLNLNENKKYQDIYHNKIRNITRFTYSETIAAREKLFRLGVLKTKKEIVYKIDAKLKKLLIYSTDIKNKKVKNFYDLVVNVSGPLKIESISNEMPLIKSLKNQGAKTRSGGFIVNNNFKISGLKNIYTTGILARGFNPERKTIIKAILKNSQKCGRAIAKTFLML